MKTTTTHTTTHTVTLKDGTELELELPHQPSYIMEYKDPLFLELDDKLVLGYLVDDRDCANPLTDCDGMGAIYDCRRGSGTLGDYEHALGLYDGGPNLHLLDEEDVVEEAIRRICDDPATLARTAEWCRQHWDQPDGRGDDRFVEDCLDSINELTPIFDVDALQLELWQAGRAAGTIGDKHAVMLDVYEHSGVSYSLSGQGMQCQFDTARGGAVWVPDDCAREELLRRAEAYRKGKIVEQRLRSKTQYEVQHFTGSAIDYTSAGMFDDWGAAFEHLAGLPARYERPQLDAEYAAARELAAQAAEQYTDWCNGNCFTTVVVTYDRAGNEIDNDTCSGYVGDDWAYQALKENFS